MMQMRPVKERLFMRLIALGIHRCASGGAKVQERANKKPSGEPEGFENYIIFEQSRSA